MITNFEDKLYPLSELETKLVPAIKHLFNVRPANKPLLGKENVTTADELIKQLESSQHKIPIFMKCGLTEEEAKKYKLDRTRLARFVKHLRIHHGMFICCSSKGYWLANTEEEKLSTIKSFYERVIGSLFSIRGLENIELNVTPEAIEYRKQIITMVENWGGYKP